MAKIKASKSTFYQEVNLADPEKMEVLNIISTNGLNLILDNSLSKYANDKFFIEQAEIVDRKFENYKTNTSQSDSDV